MNLSDYFKKSVSTGLGKSLGSTLVAVIFIPLIIRNIGIENYGIWMLLVIFMGISSVADIGLSKSLVYFLPRQKSQEDINEMYSAGFFLNGFSVLLVVVFGFIVFISGVNVWGANASIPYETGRLLLVSGLIIAACSLATTFYRFVLEAFYKIYIVNIGFLLLTALNYISIYLLSFVTDKIEHFILVTTAIYIFMFFSHWAIVRTKLNISLHVPRLATIRKMVKYSFGFFIVGSFFTITDSANRYLIIFFGGSAATYGIFDVALKVAFMGFSCLQAFAAPLFSIFAHYGEERMSEIKHILNRSVFWISGVYVVGCLLFLIFGRHALDIFLGKNSPELFNASLILVLGIAFFGIAEPFHRALLGLGNLWLVFKINAVQLVTNFLFIAIFTDLDPLYRLSLAYSLSWAMTAVIHIIAFRFRYFHADKSVNQDLAYK